MFQPTSSEKVLVVPVAEDTTDIADNDVLAVLEVLKVAPEELAAVPPSCIPPQEIPLPIA